MSLLRAARYPFTEEAKGYVKKLIGEGWRLNDYIIEKAKERIINAFNNKLPFFVEREDIEQEEILNYAVAKMIVSLTDDRYIIAKYSIGEAKRAKEYLVREDQETVNRVAKELGLEFVPDGEGYLLHFVQFIRNQPGSPEYLLINRDLRNGYVRITAEERIRILEEAIRRHVERKVKLTDPPASLVRAAEDVKASLPKPVRNIEKRVGDIPPCIESLINDLYQHKNLSHMGRVFLTMYLHKAGWSDEEIIELFSNSPDFNIKITEYQVKYISSHDYSVPNCSTVQSYGLCVADCGIKNPLQYRAGKKDTKRKGDRDASRPIR